MLAEAAESVRLIEELCETGAGPGLAERRLAAEGAAPVAPGSAGPSPPAARRWRGWRSTTAAGSRRARLRPAAVRNWRGFDDACRSQNVFTDIPIIEASFWLTVAGTAR